jgi:hypothetical protein
MASNPNKIEVGDTVSLIMGEGGRIASGVVVALPDNQLPYWIMRGAAPNLNIYYVSLHVPVLQLVSKA